MGETNAPGYYVDFSCFPLLLERAVSPIRGESHLPEVAWIYDSAHARESPFVTVSDLRATTFSDLRFRTGIAEYNARNEARARKNVLATILIIDSVLTRGLVTSVFWWRPPTSRVEIVRTPEVAAETVTAVWRAHGIEPSEAMRLGLERLRAGTVRYQPARQGACPELTASDSRP